MNAAEPIETDTDARPRSTAAVSSVAVVRHPAGRSQPGPPRRAQLVQVYPRQIITPMKLLFSDGAAEMADPRFVEMMTNYLGGKRGVIPIGRARAGIYLLVKQAITPDRVEVIMSPYTIPDIVNMVIFAGGIPVFVDCIPNSTNVSTEAIDKVITRRAAAVVLTHYHVNQAHTAEIVRLCHQRSVRIFDDCAVSFGSSYAGAPIGAITDASVMSFSTFKILNFLWGGAVSIRSDDVYGLIASEVAAWPRLRVLQYKTQALKTLAFSLATSRTLFPLVFKLRRPRAIGRKIDDVFPLSRIETRSIDATITSRPHVNALREWNEKFSTLTEHVAHRRAVASIYDQYFRDLSVSGETTDALRAESCFINYPIIVAVNSRDELYRKMLRAGFDVGLSLYPNVHEVETFTDIAGESKNVSNLVRSVLTLPTHGRITPKYAHELARCLTRILSAPDARSVA